MCQGAVSTLSGGKKGAGAGTGTGTHRPPGTQTPPTLTPPPPHPTRPPHSAAFSHRSNRCQRVQHGPCSKYIKYAPALLTRHSSRCRRHCRPHSLGHSLRHFLGRFLGRSLGRFRSHCPGPPRPAHCGRAGQRRWAHGRAGRGSRAWLCQERPAQATRTAVPASTSVSLQLPGKQALRSFLSGGGWASAVLPHAGHAGWGTGPSACKLHLRPRTLASQPPCVPLCAAAQELPPHEGAVPPVAPTGPSRRPPPQTCSESGGTVGGGAAGSPSQMPLAPSRRQYLALAGPVSCLPAHSSCSVSRSVQPGIATRRS